MKPGPGYGYGEGIRGIEAEKPDAWLAVGDDVGSDVQLGEGGNPGEGWSAAETHTGHAERNNTNPGKAGKGVYFKARRNSSAQGLLRDGPMREEEIVPALRHDPWAGWQRPRAMMEG